MSGTITVTANASDNVAVAGVQFLLDGAALGAEDTSSPYSISWDTRDGRQRPAHAVGRARDAAGNQTTTPAVAVTVSNAAPTGLVAAYAFNEGTGTTTADATGTGHLGTLTGAVWTAAGKNGSALSFDGVNDWVTVNDANDLDLTNGMTLEAWVRPTALSGWNSVVMKEHGTDTLAYSLYANDDGPYPAVTIRVGVINQTAPGAAPLPLGHVDASRRDL